MDLFPAGEYQGQGYMGEYTVPEADHHIGLTGHARVNGMVGEIRAVNTVIGIGYGAPDKITRIDIFQIDGNIAFNKILLDLFLEKEADIRKFEVSRGII